MRTAGSSLVLSFCLSMFVAGSLRAEEPAGWKGTRNPKPVTYDDFSDGRWEKRTGKDPWGRKLPEWELKAPQNPWSNKMATKAIDASKGYLSYEYKKGVSFSIPSKVAYGTWEWKYRFPKGRTPYTGHANKKLGVVIVSEGEGGFYSRDVASDGHGWFMRASTDRDPADIRHGRGGRVVHLLHNEKGGWGSGLFVDSRWHVCRITRDPKNGFTIYYDNRIVSSGYRAGNPRDNGKSGLFNEVKDDTHKTCERFSIGMMAASSPGSVDVDDVRIFDVVIPPPTDTPLRELYAIGQGKDPAKLPALVNYAGAKTGAKASGSAGEKLPATASANMIDGVTTDYDGGRGLAYSLWPNYLTVQLKEARPVKELYVSLWDLPSVTVSVRFPGPRKYDFEVDVSADGTNWTNVADGKKAVQIQRIPVGGRKVKFIRMRGRHYREYRDWTRKFPAEPEVKKIVDEFYVVEVEAYGQDGK